MIINWSIPIIRLVHLTITTGIKKCAKLGKLDKTTVEIVCLR